MQLPVPALDTEAAAISGTNGRGGAIPNAIHRVSVVTHTLFLFLRTSLGTSPGVVAGDRNIGLVRPRLLFGVEGVASPAATSPDTQAVEGFAVLRQRDHVWHTTGA